MPKTSYRKNSTKKKKQNKISIFVVLTVVCVSVFSIIYKDYLDSDYSKSGPSQSTVAGQEPSGATETSARVTDANKLLEPEQVTLLENYAHSYADTLAYLEPASIDHLYSDNKSEAFSQNKAAFDVLVSIRKMRDMDLTLEYAEVEYIIQKTENEGSRTTVYLLEKNTQKFRYLDQPSYSANLYHEFTLTEVDGNWYIESHYHEEDFYLLTLEGWEDATGTDNITRGENAVNLILADARENLSDLSQFQQGTYYTNLQVADTSYNRQRAVDYARQWWNQRNYNGNYLAYDEFGGNCQNFASQCLHAGGINMDHTGTIDNQWKFYDETLSSKQTASGRSYSWTGVDMFYSYAVASYKSGLVSLTDIEYKYAEKGDIVQVGAYNHWRHALVVTDVLKNADGTVKDIVVASNTADRWNYPLFAYIYTAPRLIHILGQN